MLKPTSDPKKPPTMMPKAAAIEATTRLTHAPCTMRAKVSRAPWRSTTSFSRSGRSRTTQPRVALAADFLFLPPLLMKLEEKTNAQSALDGAGVSRASA